MLDALKNRVAQGVIGYTDIAPEYLAAVTGWCERRHRWTIDTDWIVPTGGIVPGICNLLEALTPTDAQVIVQPPVYDPFYSVIKASGRRQVENPLILDETGYHMDFAGLEELCKAGASALVLCSPHNPLGIVWTKEQLTFPAGGDLRPLPCFGHQRRDPLGPGPGRPGAHHHGSVPPAV